VLTAYKETLRILGVAFAQVCIALRIGDCDDHVRQAIASKIIELAKTGERNPDLYASALWKIFANCRCRPVTPIAFANP
jgi:hypothetical protein